MCYNSKDRPPEPPGAVGGAHGEDIELSAADGARFAAYIAEPEQATGAQVLIYPDVRGLHQFYKELALRFAQVGMRALAIDYFGRTAGISARDDAFEFWPHVQQMQVPHFLADVQAALAYLDPSQPTFTVGFCMGGSLSLFSGAQNLPLAGIIGFYAGLNRVMTGAQGSPLERASHIHVPVLGLFGGADQGIPVTDVEKLDEQLDRAGVEHQIIVYPGAPHSFFDRKYAEYAEASADAWTRVLDFIQAHRK